eukprot:TRINITY_DN20372_c0_g1_i2.p1 TRINITY_DN20372_c0_g1~~TRINITY_DN20372_c0_g1_i2.p1  ORF type:complete len:151 (-),score=28.34 TRINITY_DN20372_c0_g1_i2:19-471(-)
MRGLTTIRAMVIDNPVIDIVAHCPSSLLKQFDLVTGGSCPSMNDTTVRDRLFERIRGMSPVLAPGGGALNSIRALSWMLPRNMDAELTALGVVGADSDAETLKQQLGEAGVQAQFAESETPVSYTHLRAHETVLDLVCRLLLEKKKKNLL